MECGTAGERTAEGVLKFVCGSQPEVREDGSDQEEGARSAGPGRQKAGDRSGNHRRVAEGLRATGRSDRSWRDHGATEQAAVRTGAWRRDDPLFGIREGAGA